MFKLMASDVIQTLKTELLGERGMMPDAQGYFEALVVSLGLTLVKPEGNKRCRIDLNFLMTRNTSVWMSRGAYQTADLTKWVNTSNHDSCWRTDGIETRINEVYFEVAHDVAPKMAPCDLDDYSSFYFHDSIRFVKVKVTRDDDGTGRHLYKLTEVKEMPR
jgi:hypothetical protein